MEVVVFCGSMLESVFTAGKWYNDNMKKEYLERVSYPTDLTDEQWAILEPLFVGMREYKYSKRELLNALLYVVDSGCKWRQLPHDFPVWQTVYSFFRRATKKGLWNKVLEHLVKVTRQKAGRNSNPSYAIIDSQSVKSVYASDQRGFDGGKKRKAEKDT
jgi:putative transposase